MVLMSKPSLLSLFSGAGGLDLGFHWADFETCFANEYDKQIWATFQKNFPDVKLDKRSIANIKIEEIPNADGLIGRHHVKVGLRRAQGVVLTMLEVNCLLIIFVF